MNEIVLTGPQGDNPLGFLTALGTLRVLTDIGSDVALRWTPEREPVLSTAEPPDKQGLVNNVCRALSREAGT